MAKFVQMIVTPEDATWQGRLIALDEDGAIYEVAENQQWRWICGNIPKSPAPSAEVK